MMVVTTFVDGREEYTKYSHVVSVCAVRELYSEVEFDPVFSACEINKRFAPVTSKARRVAY